MTVPLVAKQLTGDAAAAVAAITTSKPTMALGTPWENNKPLWVFGYGSIIHKVDFPVEASVFGFIRGRKRAFLQDSHDHRGTEENPGRVCTLIPVAEWNRMFRQSVDPHSSVCWGVAYKVQSGKEAEVKKHLDYREKDGYTIDFVDVFEEEGIPPVLRNVMVYVGVSDNPSFAGASSIEETATIIAKAEGPSGTNREYLFRLCNALRERRDDALDPYLRELEERVKELAAAS
ncbi:hypothetical protein EC988_001314 [Linderina pennispora]|nr:hypothetical protein EC988_001314 [Linderina pennispora]